MTDDPKYRLTDETIQFDDKTLHRIEAVRCFGGVAAGDLGGFVETEDNLSHDGNCWIMSGAKVYGDARIEGNAFISMNSVVSGNAVVTDSATIIDSTVRGHAEISRNSHVVGSNVYGSARIHTAGSVRYSTVGGSSAIFDDASMYMGTLLDDARLVGNAEVSNDATVSGTARIRDIHVRSNVSQDPVIIKGFRYQVVVTDTHVTIGCQSHPFKVWTKGLFMPMNKGYRILRVHNVRHKDAVRMIRALKEIIALHDAKVRRALAGKKNAEM